MANKTYSIISIIIAVIIFLRCGKDCQPTYVFQVPLELSSYDSIVPVGDTLHISMLTYNTDLSDTDNRRVSFPNFDPRMTVILMAYDTLVYQDIQLDVPIIISEEYTYEVSQRYNNNTTAVLLHGIKTDEFTSEIDLALVMDVMPGTYALHFVSSLSFISSSIEFEDRCGNGKIYASYILPTERIVNSEILTEDEKVVNSEFFGEGGGFRVITSSYHFKVIE